MLLRHPGWKFLRQLLVRFWTCYFFLFYFPFPFYYFPLLSSLNQWYRKAFDGLLLWTGKNVFHISFVLPSVSNGSGDASYDYVQLFLFVLLAAIMAFIWSVFNKLRKNHDLIIHYVFLYTQFYFGCIMIKYGAEKIIKAQFPFPFTSLTETYGDSSPLRLMWSFMGYSPSYNLFIGGSEAIAGLLVLFRRTRTLGTLISVVILTNVTILNFCYDVPVKLFALNLLLMAVFLIAPDSKRLAHFFILHKTIAVGKTSARLFTNNAKPNILWFSIKSGITFCIIYSMVGSVLHKYYYFGDGAFSQTPLFGIYRTQTFIKNGDTLLPLLTDTSQWKTIDLIYKKKATIRMINDSAKSCHFIIDTVKKTIQLSDVTDSSYKAAFVYSTPDSAHLVLNGKLKGDSVYIVMRKQDLNKYRLINRGFHWINESPYNE